MCRSRSFISGSFMKLLRQAASGWAGAAGGLINFKFMQAKNIQKLLYYPERGPVLDVDFSFPLRGPLAHPIRLRVTNIPWEGSHVQIEELHRGASFKLSTARRHCWAGRLGVIHTENLSKRKIYKSDSIIPSADPILISISVFHSADH